MNELQINSLEITEGSIKFPEFSKIKSEATQLADGLKSVTVTADTLQTNKKLLANVNKRVFELETVRKNAKKQLLKPYSVFEAQVKEIVKIVNDASNTIKDQERELEEIRKAEKRSDVEDLFDKRLSMYEGFPLTFEQFLQAQPQVLNKSISISKSENILANWFETKSKDIEVASRMEDADLILTKYIQNPESITEVIQTVQREKEARRQAVEAIKVSNTPEQRVADAPVSKPTTILIHDSKEAEIVIDYMKAMNLNYTLI